MKEIIKKRMNRYTQLISVLYAFFIFVLCYTTFFSSVSDASLRIMIKDELTFITAISFGSLLKEVIGAILEFRQEREKRLYLQKKGGERRKEIIKKGGMKEIIKKKRE